MRVQIHAAVIGQKLVSLPFYIPLASQYPHKKYVQKSVDVNIHEDKKIGGEVGIYSLYFSGAKFNSSWIWKCMIVIHFIALAEIETAGAKSFQI